MIRRHFTWAASSPLPTKYGEFLTHVFTDTTDDGPKKEHVALVYSDVAGGRRIPASRALRVHHERSLRFVEV